ncbi:MAG: GTP-binding protein [Candidatus Odinarchaeota archaeon]|nr:GTP-binding protein [Candidatus Odinarchaeota archaeon]
MIREIFVRKVDDGNVVLHEKYTNTKEIPVEALEKTFYDASKTMPEGEIEHTDIIRYSFSYMHAGGLYFCIFFDRVVSVEERMESMIFLSNKILSKYESELPPQEEMKKIALMTVQRLPVKIGFIGFGGVGKTTTLKLLRQEEVPLEYVPTIFGDRRPLAVPVGPYRVIVFDFAGQKRFMSAWDILIRGSEVIFVMTDSTPANVDATKEEILPLVLTKAPYAKKYAIANKQDLPGALPPSEVGRRLGLPAYGLIAIDPTQREKIMKLIREAILE